MDAVAAAVAGGLRRFTVGRSLGSAERDNGGAADIVGERLSRPDRPTRESHWWGKPQGG